MDKDINEELHALSDAVVDDLSPALVEVINKHCNGKKLTDPAVSMCVHGIITASFAGVYGLLRGHFTNHSLTDDEDAFECAKNAFIFYIDKLELKG